MLLLPLRLLGTAAQLLSKGSDPGSMCVWSMPCTKHGVAGVMAAEGVGPEPAPC